MCLPAYTPHICFLHGLPQKARGQNLRARARGFSREWLRPLTGNRQWNHPQHPPPSDVIQECCSTKRCILLSNRVEAMSVQLEPIWLVWMRECPLAKRLSDPDHIFHVLLPFFFFGGRRRTRESGSAISSVLVTPKSRIPSDDADPQFTASSKSLRVAWGTERLCLVQSPTVNMRQRQDLELGPPCPPPPHSTPLASTRPITDPIAFPVTHEAMFGC